MNFSSKFLLLLTVAAANFAMALPSYASSKQIFAQEELAKLEASTGGKLGISAINTANNARIDYRAEQRFPMGCTSKVVGVAAILKRSMSDNQLLDEKITYTKKELLAWAPVTTNHVAEGMTVEELAAAAISYSDNTAMNLLVKKLGGLQAFNNFAHSIGDPDFKLDHGWPEEAMAKPDGLQDSTTPKAMAQSLQKMALGDVLAPPLREKLQNWLKNNTTGNARIRAGAPKGWLVGDKTGTGFHYGTTNDIAIIWPPTCQPIVVAIYYTHHNKNAVKRDDVLASATRILLKEFARNDACLKMT